MEIDGDPLQSSSRPDSPNSTGYWKKAIRYASDVDYAILFERDASPLAHIFLDTIYISAHKRTILPSIAQKATSTHPRYDIDWYRSCGPAQDYLAMARVAELMKITRQNYSHPTGRRSR